MVRDGKNKRILRMSHQTIESQRVVYLIEDGIITIPVEKWKVREILRRWVAEKERLAMAANDLDSFNGLRQANRALRRTPADNLQRIGGIVSEVGITLRRENRK